MRVLRCISFVLLLVMALAVRANPQVQQLWQLLDYIAVDYGAAVQDGAVVSELEYAEMQEFSATVGEGLAGLPAEPARAGLVQQAQALQQAIAAKVAPADIATRAKTLADRLLERDFSRSLGRERFLTTLLLVFAGVGLSPLRSTGVPSSGPDRSSAFDSPR